jgi:hypothetical protein
MIPVVAPRSGATWLLDAKEIVELVETEFWKSGTAALKLTIPGWRRYEELKKGRSVSRTAFMTMQFGDADLNTFIDQCFRPAVARTNFKQRAGLIDDQLRVALRTARFAIADVTHGNRGAYWEAGFAEGLGKPVIYTCRKEEWKAGRSHFDTNHLVTVIWEPDKPGKAAEQLVNHIRATLPEEAKMTDDPE